MKSMSLVKEGFCLAGRHKRLAVVLWLVPLVAALLLGAMAYANIAPVFDKSFYADRVLDGDWWIVLMEFRSSPADALDPILHRGMVVMALLTLLLGVALSAGVVEVLLERESSHPFALGVGKNFFRFFRTTILLMVVTIVPVLAAGLVARGFLKLAEAQGDARFDLVGIGLAAVVFLMMWAPLKLAADVSRIAAVRHEHKSMVRGFFRALARVLRRPGLFAPMYLVFLALPLLLVLVYHLLRSPWTPATAWAIVALAVVQQAVMLLRSFFRVAFWGAEFAAFTELDEPELCRPKTRSRRVEEPVAEDLVPRSVEPAPFEGGVEAEDPVDSPPEIIRSGE